ncbi:MAG: hypothetical protein ACLFQV_00635 [Vulcanimicrobiota bacterium]
MNNIAIGGFDRKNNTGFSYFENIGDGTTAKGLDAIQTHNK